MFLNLQTFSSSRIMSDIKYYNDDAENTMIVEMMRRAHSPSTACSTE